MNAFGRAGVMTAAGGVDVVVATVKTPIGRVDPALQVGREFGVPTGGYVKRLADLPILRAAAILDHHVARRQKHGAAVGSVDLRLEKQVRRQPLGLRRVDMAGRVAK